MFAWLKPAPEIARLPAEQVDPVYRRLRRQVFAGIFLGYAGYYLVRKNFSLAIPDILKAYPQHTKAELGTALTALSVAYGFSKFLMGSVSDRSNPRYFLPLGLALSAAVTLAFGCMPALYLSLSWMICLQGLNGWCNGMGWAPCGKTMVHWFSRGERGRAVSCWNVAHNVGGALVATLAACGVMLLGDWTAKFTFNAGVALVWRRPRAPARFPRDLPYPCPGQPFALVPGRGQRLRLLRPLWGRRLGAHLPADRQAFRLPAIQRGVVLSLIHI